MACFDYLNLSDRQMSGDHFDFTGPRIPVCTAETWSYYHHRGLCVRSFQELRMLLRTESRKGKSPILIHFDYRPSSGDYGKEIQRAFCAEHISGNHRLYFRPTLNNLAVRQI
jgi:hypothetical protein